MNNRIKELRKEKHWTQQKLAEYFHVSPSTIHSWERGDVPMLIDDFHTLAMIFGVSMEYLGGYRDERNR
ncbi:helix-turn-helix transcriptional regulator [Companilactobacillus ginsenosidimutans]|uniref:helix-turn-helix transcriptional regulator n=1 Tax=Companilactobacillus ginsenosidimutans TaxID=1007676 RepID=UPI00069FC24A|nr:helix-turn-helix transcriptional regulator [Companilactobacillus ginsenosidimutans]